VDSSSLSGSCVSVGDVDSFYKRFQLLVNSQTQNSTLKLTDVLCIEGFTKE